MALFSPVVGAPDRCAQLHAPDKLNTIDDDNNEQKENWDFMVGKRYRHRRSSSRNNSERQANKNFGIYFTQDGVKRKEYNFDLILKEIKKTLRC